MSSSSISPDQVTAELTEIGHRFLKSLSWSAHQGPDWETFRSVFHPTASLTPAARPASPVDVETFIGRMQAQRDNGSIVDFQERQLSARIHVFGNVATMFQTYSTIINHQPPGYGTSAMIFIHDNGQWLCQSMAWDAQTADKRIPTDYMSEA